MPLGLCITSEFCTAQSKPILPWAPTHHSATVVVRGWLRSATKLDLSETEYHIRARAPSRNDCATVISWTSRLWWGGSRATPGAKNGGSPRLAIPPRKIYLRFHSTPRKIYKSLDPTPGAKNRFALAGPMALRKLCGSVEAHIFGSIEGAITNVVRAWSTWDLADIDPVEQFVIL